ncbi:NADP-dependent 3-hydroxy acid dehydrogenase YdfG [Sphingomonas laterariae]|uniref:NADP-dependent 3-hydroxy acid dehydrogenase YdfG n=1 Tax=Edaphosphingomonas laterariae TaxID=861865 RepID=A0A239EX80_9SPHN|nr:SDR family NAD(P)-dependent oxidoreductase [Sphingomonas laterariae]SNS48653.1 NADP-dependent 3-hydroxy acid dehydrogenase YdfG [Sphingomonas laterariae]
MQDFTDKVAVITGAASGVGKQVALRLARAGAKVVLADIEPNALEAAVSDVKAAGGTAIGHVTDVSKREAVDALRDRALAEYGKVNIVINNAGVGGGGGPTIWDTPEKAYRWAMDVNFFGPLNGILSFMPTLIAQGEDALMASTSSGAGIVFPPSGAAYSASKAALIALMEVLAYQLQFSGTKVRAAILFPGPHVVDTNLFSSHRNLQKEYDDPAIASGAGINNVDEFQAAMKMLIGHEVPLTQPEDFAEEVYQSILRDDFYILPLTDKTKDAIRKRYDDMIERRQPAIPDMM